MTVYSHSRISAFEQCPLKFKFAYLEEVETEMEGSVEAFMGSRVHDALEKLYKDLKFQKLDSLHELLDFYNSEWEKNWNERIRLVRKDYEPENFKKMGEKFIRDYYHRYKPFDQARTVGLEMQVVIKLDDKGEFVVQGFIDRLASPEEGVYEIHDYKTSNSLPTTDDLDTDRQLALYSLAVNEMFQDCRKVNLIWHYLAFDKEFRSERSEEQLRALKQEVINSIKQIESTKDFQPKESRLCSWCDFREICPRFSHLFEVDEKTPEEFLADDGVKLVNQYALLKAEEEKIAAQLEELKEKIFSFAEQKKLDRVYGSDASVSVWKKECLKFPSKDDENYAALIQLLKNQGLWEEFSSLDKYRLEKAFEGGQIDFNKMKELAKFASKELVKRLYLRASRAN